MASQSVLKPLATQLQKHLQQHVFAAVPGLQIRSRSTLAAYQASSNSEDGHSKGAGGRSAPWVRTAAYLAGGVALAALSQTSHGPVSCMIDESTGEPTSAESKTASAAAYSKAKLFKPDPRTIEPSRKVIVLIGLTGAGKSATANTLCGAKRCFEVSGSVASVTSAVRVRDYSFNGTRWRVIDTPGLGDTHRPAEDIKAEMLEAWRYAEHGVAAFLVVIPRGRLTAEVESRVREALETFGGSAAIPYTIIAMTRTQDAPEKVVDEIMRLPSDHTLRRLCELVGNKVVPVENMKEPAISVSRLLLHKAVDEVLEMNNEERYLNPTGGPKSLIGGAANGLASLSDVLANLPKGRCSTQWAAAVENRLRMTVTCDFPVVS
mmetsp:Transcript_54703/g.116871  ORF Transcript_54703/g.116871 Transcript_54703/m.116871 type:complete len:377 (-) Transcript_54703:310-1440(-)